MIPKILYHGTTQARFHLGIETEGLKGDKPRHMQIDNQHLGYNYLAESFDDAIFYSLYTLELDKLTKELRDISNISNSAIVISIRTSPFRKTIEEDPEYHDTKKRWKSYGLWETAQELVMRGMYYRTKTTILPKYFAQVFIVPAEQQDPAWMKMIRAQAMDKQKENINQILIREAEKSEDFVELTQKVFLKSEEAKTYFFSKHKDHTIKSKPIIRYDGVHDPGHEPDSFLPCLTCKECVVFDSKNRDFIKKEIEDEVCYVRKDEF